MSKGFICVLALGAAATLGGCVGQSDVDALRADIVRTQEMVRSLQEDTQSATTQAEQAARAADAAAQSARDAAAEARAARESAQLASERAERIQRSTLRK